ncbi:hypothetical protein EG68_03274 [Paragonimus skrjabini miyazakii]|uniref:ADP-ribosylation factor-like protein 2-binding protein n=1 Tax=Paragonimus skrjabini miyazakii TaxID=59628 RepID=A0A8S9YB31_9TREM|nr:hypothetical protein EG68_03274 [Paragonimus skrjabini miyazakii]
MEVGDIIQENNCEQNLSDSDDELIAGSVEESPCTFDIIIGYLEDIIISDEFQAIQSRFIEDNCRFFDASEENKFCYTDIHNNYVNVVERFLEKELKNRINDFVMSDFLSDLSHCRKELDGEVFEMLYTFTDFLAFKEMMLDYKNAKTGTTVDLALTNTYVTCPSDQPDPLMLLQKRRCTEPAVCKSLYADGEQTGVDQSIKSMGARLAQLDLDSLGSSTH